MKPLSVHILFEHSGDHIPHGVAHIRDILPLTHPENQPFFEVTTGIEFLPADILIVERTWKPGVTFLEAEALVAQAQRNQVRLLYSIDDNLLDLEAIPLEIRMVVRYFCRVADGIIVSTEYLKQRLSSLNAHIWVVPNALDERLFANPALLEEQHPKSEVIRLGYMGTFTHDADLMMILQPLRQVLRKYRDSLELEIVGGLANDGFLRALGDLPVRRLQVPPQDVTYPNFVRWLKANIHWVLGLAPLEDSRFTRSKSDIKFLDYSALGIPGIYSQVPSYQESVRHLETGWLAENTPQAWLEALETLLFDDNLRMKIRESAHQHVYSQRTLKQCASQWRSAIEQLIRLSPS